MKKLKAFTLIELLVGMILSSIVIAFGYGSYTLIGEQFNSFRKIKQELSVAAQLNSVLSSDLHSADLAAWENDRLLLRADSLLVSYHFLDSAVLRTIREEKDTFFLKAAEVHPVFVFPGTHQAIRHFSFTAMVLNESTSFHYSKEYSAAELIAIEQKLQKQDSWE